MLAALRARGHGTLCFFGPPGTGKTALAEHLAQTLQRPLMVRQRPQGQRSPGARGHGPRQIHALTTA